MILNVHFRYMLCLPGRCTMAWTEIINDIILNTAFRVPNYSPSFFTLANIVLFEIQRIYLQTYLSYAFKKILWEVYEFVEQCNPEKIVFKKQLFRRTQVHVTKVKKYNRTLNTSHREGMQNKDNDFDQLNKLQGCSDHEILPRTSKAQTWPGDPC